MTTITQEMMHSNLPAYTGIITRINPIKRVAAWVDDLEDLEVPEEDLDFNHVRSILAKSPPALETLESIDLWDTDSENSTSRSDDVPNTETLSRAMSSVTVSTMSIMQLSQLSQPSVNGSIRPENRGGVQRTDSRAGLRADTEAMETLDDDFDLPEDFNSLRLQLPGLNNQEPYQSGSIKNRCLLKSHVSLQQWRDSGSDIDDFEFGTPLDNNSLSSSASFSRDSMVDEENFLDGIIFPEAMEGLQLVINRTYRPELDPSIFGKESRFQEEQDDFWDGLGVDDDDAFNHKGRNKNLIVRAAPMGRDRSESRVQREVVPLKDFVALPSRIPRLCRTPGDNSKSITPAQSLSRMHSTQFELPLRDLRSKSSIPRMRRSSIPKKNGTRSSLIISSVDPSEGSSACSSTFTSRAPTPTALQFTGSKRSSLLSNTDDFPSFKASSLAMRSVSFTEPAETTRLDNLKSGELALSLANSPRAKPPTPQNQGKSFSGLRTLVRKLELVRPKFSTRSPIPVFESVATLESESRPLALPYPAKSNPPIEPENDLKGALKRPPNSRSSSCTDWGSLLASTEITKESRPSSRAGLVSLGDISEVLATDPGETVTPVAATDRFSRRVFLKRSPKHSTFGDGSELDRFDNLPTFGPRQKREEERLQASQVVVQVRRHSTERVAAWLRKPQSIANFKEFHKPEGNVAQWSSLEGPWQFCEAPILHCDLFQFCIDSEGHRVRATLSVEDPQIQIFKEVAI
ncbi:hypothetical protein BC939DRAFT_54584 [Gamsiella multidivaricata]|uniref:uncharacterized protein n=1 Tax=Gamsiella multidivaricata TaxID=101098 RepID=UPI00221E3D0A|nr:uncharacterized protein BC939DRAFT_54584 [Gamsiella multidivaricata]KAI7816251.1 hypothetical protein BC939DRAFT_54584 [Gamsiella multidivaricata]